MDNDMNTELQTQTLEPEPAVYYNGKLTDASEHAAILDNPVANRMSDELAAIQARQIGFTEEEIQMLILGGDRSQGGVT